MSDLDDFVTRYHHGKALVDPAQVARGQVDPETLDEIGANYRRICERGGFDLTDLSDQARQTAGSVVPVMAVRVAAAIASRDLGGELLDYGAGAWMDGFLAGVLWQQERDLPDPAA